MKSLLKYLKSYKKESLLAPLFKMLEAVFELFVPLVMASVIDTGIADNDRSYIIIMCLFLIGLAIIGLVCSILAQFFAAKAAVGFATSLRKDLFHHIQSLSFTEMDTVGDSTLITRMTSDVNQVQSGVNMVLRLFLRSPFIVIGAMVMAFTIDIKAALVFVVTIPLLSIVVFGIMLISMPLYKKVQQGLDKILGITRENLTGARVIRAFDKEQDETENFAISNNVLARQQKYVGRISALMNPVTYVIINIAIIALLLTGAIRVDNGILTQGQVVALVNYMSQILVELVKFANLIVTVNKGLACAGRIENIFQIQSGMEDGNNVLENHGESNFAVEFDKVALMYKNAGEESLTDINFKVRKGETIGVIGGTGSGKSSLVNMIPRFYDVSAGTVRVDGTDVRTYTMESLRIKIGMVLQKAVLFKGTIRENVCWGNPNATDAQVKEALEIAQAKEFVDTKEGGLDFMIEQEGKNLSGGQKQRMTIARAIVRKPEILILDDSASALDFATDAKLRQAIKNMESKPTVFIVSQRATSIKYADHIIVLDDGRICGVGTHEELIAHCSVYQEIYYSQVNESKEA